MKVIGASESDDKEAQFLNRTISIDEFGVNVEGDNKHSQILLEEWGMTHANGVDTPLTTELTQLSNNRPLMDAIEAKRYRRGVARIKYMAQYRCDLSSVIRVMSQSMYNPRCGDEVLINIVLRCIRIYPRCVSQFKFQDAVT